MDSSLQQEIRLNASEEAWFCHVPGPPLSSFVAKLWAFSAPAQVHSRERLLPDGSAELIIDLLPDRAPAFDPSPENRSPYFDGAMICGPHSRSFWIDTDTATSVLGVHFHPGGAFPFLGLPTGELHNQHVALEDLWGPAAAQLREKLILAATPGTRFRILEHALLQRLQQLPGRHPAVDLALKVLGRVPQPLSIGELTRQIGLSSRRFIQLFTDQVGLTPKLYGRVCRFQQVLDRIQATAAIDWGQIALDCGYYDQAHFNQDFRAFSGLTPTDYRRLQTQHKNHVRCFD